MFFLFLWFHITFLFIHISYLLLLPDASFKVIQWIYITTSDRMTLGDGVGPVALQMFLNYASVPQHQ